MIFPFSRIVQGICRCRVCIETRDVKVRYLAIIIDCDAGSVTHFQGSCSGSYGNAKTFGYIIVNRETSCKKKIIMCACQCYERVGDKELLRPRKVV